MGPARISGPRRSRQGVLPSSTWRHVTIGENAFNWLVQHLTISCITIVLKENSLSMKDWPNGTFLVVECSYGWKSWEWRTRIPWSCRELWRKMWYCFRDASLWPIRPNPVRTWGQLSHSPHLRTSIGYLFECTICISFLFKANWQVNYCRVSVTWLNSSGKN